MGHFTNGKIKEVKRLTQSHKQTSRWSQAWDLDPNWVPYSLHLVHLLLGNLVVGCPAANCLLLRPCYGLNCVPPDSYVEVR